MILGKQVNACFFLAVHVVQKKINWANKEAIIVIADEQQKKRPSIQPAEKNNKNRGFNRRRQPANFAAYFPNHRRLLSGINLTLNFI
jgi:hypothetical protein